MGKLSFVAEKCFLEAIELANKPRDQTQIKPICDRLQDFCGKPGTSTRRDVQERWNNLRRRSIRSYIEHLKSFEIEPSKARLEELRLHGTEPSDDSDSDSDTNDFDPSPQVFSLQLSFGDTEGKFEDY